MSIIKNSIKALATNTPNNDLDHELLTSTEENFSDKPILEKTHNLDALTQHLEDLKFDVHEIILRLEHLEMRQDKDTEALKYSDIGLKALKEKTDRIFYLLRFVAQQQPHFEQQFKDKNLLRNEDLSALTQPTTQATRKINKIPLLLGGFFLAFLLLIIFILTLQSSHQNNDEHQPIFALKELLKQDEQLPHPQPVPNERQPLAPKDLNPQELSPQELEDLITQYQLDVHEQDQSSNQEESN